MELCPGIQILLNVEGELFIIIGCVLVVRVLRQIVFIRQEGTNASQLQDAFAAVHDCQFIPAHKLFATMSSDEFKIGKKIPLLVMRRGIKCDIQKLDSQLLNNIA